MTTETGTIYQDVSEVPAEFEPMPDAVTRPMDGDEMVEALMKKWSEDADELSEDETETEGTVDADKYQDTDDPNETEWEDTAEEEAAEEGETSEEDTDEAETEDEAEEIRYADDTDNVKITVDGEDYNVAVKDLKRMWGQESALTKRSQEVAERRKSVDALEKKHSTALATLAQQAQQAWQPYQQLDYMKLAQEMEPAQFERLKAEATQAWNMYRFHTEEMDKHFSDLEAKEQNERRDMARDAVRRINDPADPSYISEWSDELYNDIRKYAVSQGLEQQAVDNIIDPAVIKVMHKAMQFDNAKSITQKKLKTKAKPGAKRTIRSKNAPSGKAVDKKSQALRQLRSNPGDVDAATAAFMANWDD